MRGSPLFDKPLKYKNEKLKIMNKNEKHETNEIHPYQKHVMEQSKKGPKFDSPIHK